MIFFRLYLLVGLLFHKAVWISMKRRNKANAVQKAKSYQPQVIMARLIKLMILISISVQIFLPDVFPILDESFTLRVVGSVLYSLGLITAVLGRIQLGDSWSDIEVGNFPVDMQVVSEGIYRYLRHPIYVGDLLLLLGLELSLNSWLLIVVAALVPPVIFRAIQEEHSLCKKLAGYKDYTRHTKRFIPFVV